MLLSFLILKQRIKVIPNWKIRTVNTRRRPCLRAKRVATRGENCYGKITIHAEPIYFLIGDFNILPPWSIEALEPIELISEERRARAIEEAGFNTFQLKSRDVFIDLLTDSGTGAMSVNQWKGALCGDEAYAGSWNMDSLRKSVLENFGYPYVIPTHQGRGAEHLHSKVMITPGQFVPNNMYFTTRRLHQELAGGVWKDFVVPQAYEPQSRYPYKGEFDLEKLERFIAEVGRSQIAYLSVEACVNMAGGQPISMGNLIRLKRLAEKYDIPLFLDATRIICNAHYIKRYDPYYSMFSVRDIVRAMCSLSDGCTMSGKKDAVVNIGGFFATKHQSIYERVKDLVVVYEGLFTYGGLAGRDLEAMARGLYEFSEDAEVGFYIAQSRYLGEKLRLAGVPIVEPIGAHGVFLDAKRFLPHIPQDGFPAQALSAAIYRYAGVRTMERGVVSGQHGQDAYDGLELVRVTLPRRVYTTAHLKYVAEAIIKVYRECRHEIRPLRMVKEPQHLRFFNAMFEAC